MLSKIPWKKIFMGIVVLFVISHFFGSVKPEDAVNEAIEDKKFDVVAQVYKDADKNDKTKVAYAIIDAYYKETETALNKKDDSKIKAIKSSLSNGENMISFLEARENEQLGMLIRLFEFLDKYTFSENKQRDIAAKFKERYGDSIYGLDVNDIKEGLVYIAQQMEDGSYIAYDVRINPAYSAFGYNVYQSGLNYLPDYDNCIGVLKAGKGVSFDKTGAYSVSLVQTKERTTLVNKNDGFKKEYPVYRIVDKQAKEYISNYLKYDKSELIPKFQQMQKAFELMKKTYMGKNVQNLKLAGFDLNTSTEEFEKFAQEKNVKLSNYLLMREETHKKGQRRMTYTNKDNVIDLEVSNGIKLGMSKKDVDAKMSEYIAIPAEYIGTWYLMPNGQFIAYIYDKVNKVQEISFERNVVVK